MDKAKAKASEFLHKKDKHDTTVHESVKPAVVHETVKPHQHEQVTTAVDKEIHQDHHHTSVQPVHDRQVLPEKHHVNDLGTETREHRHGKDDHVAAMLDQERAKFKNEKVVSPTTKTEDSEPVIAGEHKHHHVHEVIQPVVHKETVEPHVVHSVAKVHEKHDNPATVHDTTSLPPMNIQDFKSQGGTLTGRETKTDGFAGEPRHIGGTTSTSTTTHGTNGLHSTSGLHSTNGAHSANGLHTTHGTTGGTDSSFPAHGTAGSVQHPGTTTTETSKKPSLMDKLNPKVDADGDGKAKIGS